MIQGGKLAPRPQMPFFLDMPTHHPIMAPIPTKSTSQPLAITPITSTSLSAIDKIEAMIQNIDKKLQDQEKKMEDNFSLVQKMSNELVTIKR